MPELQGGRCIPEPPQPPQPLPSPPPPPPPPPQNPCSRSPGPCQNGGTCLHMDGLDVPDGYMCICDDGYFGGSKCEIDFRNPCKLLLYHNHLPGSSLPVSLTTSRCGAPQAPRIRASTVAPATGTTLACQCQCTTIHVAAPKALKAPTVNVPAAAHPCRRALPVLVPWRPKVASSALSARTSRCRDKGAVSRARLAPSPAARAGRPAPSAQRAPTAPSA